MPRPPRLDFPDAVYHVTSGGNGLADTFCGDDDRARFLPQPPPAQCGVILYAFLLMGNHLLVCLLLFTPASPWGFSGLPTWFGPCCLTYQPTAYGAVVNLTGGVSPLGGFLLRLPSRASTCKPSSATSRCGARPAATSPWLPQLAR